MQVEVVGGPKDGVFLDIPEPCTFDEHHEEWQIYFPLEVLAQIDGGVSSRIEPVQMRVQKRRNGSLFVEWPRL